MAGRPGASGTWFPNRTARRVLTAGLALLCAMLQTEARADEPGRLQPLPPVTDGESRYEAAAPITPLGYWADGASQPSGSLLLGGEGAATVNPYGINPVAFVSPDTNADAGAVALRSGKSLLNFNRLQDPAADAANGGGGGGADATTGGEPDKTDSDKAEGAAGEQKKDGEQTFGQAPTNNSLQFLRQVDVLLKPGAWQADTGFIYTLFSNDFPLGVYDTTTGDMVDVVEADVRRRLLYSPLAVRYGLRKNMQLFAALPAGFSNTQLSTLGISETRNVSGIGDLTAGASFHLLRGEDMMPDVIGTFGFTAPTGKFDTPLFGLVPGSNLGQGFWALQGQLLCINRYDPVIVFYGGGYRHLFEREFEGVAFQPGEQVSYMLGVGFSVNDRVTFSTSFQGFYITNTIINSEDVRGSNLEPLSMRFAVTTVRNCRIIEPFVQIGVTDSAPRANVGIVVTFY